MKLNFEFLVVAGAIVLFGVPAVAQEPELYEDEFTERPEKTAATDADKKDDEIKKPSVKKKKRRCVRCGGRGKTISAERQTCDRCGGSGILATEIELKDSINARHGWHESYKTTRKSTNKQFCPSCNRSGRVMIKKEAECSLCKGSGEMP